jgi:Acyltransferase
MSKDPLVPQLRRMISDEIVAALGFPSQGWLRQVLGPFFWTPANLFASLTAQIDRTVAEKGLPSAAGQLLNRFVEGIHVFGTENVPHHGPLLIASNHPGAYDSIAILANLPRQDIRVIVSDIPFLRSLPAASRHMIYTPGGVSGRMTAVRGIIRHMEAGGTVLIFPSGRVDPDPAFLEGASEGLNIWSPSLDLIMKRVPETQLLVSIVSGVLAPACFKNPIARLPAEAWRQQKLAEFLQVIQQLLFGRKFNLRPCLSFGEPATAQELTDLDNLSDLHQSIIARARQVLALHLDNPAVRASSSIST